MHTGSHAVSRAWGGLSAFGPMNEPPTACMVAIGVEREVHIRQVIRPT